MPVFHRHDDNALAHHIRDLSFADKPVSMRDDLLQDFGVVFEKFSDLCIIEQVGLVSDRSGQLCRQLA
jgi:hypothetical protein